MIDYGNVPYGLEMINLGSTFSKYGFDYKYFGKKGFNFAVAPQPLKIDHEVLEKYKSNINKNAIVVIVAICPFVFSLYDYAELKIPVTQRAIRLIKKVIKKLIGYKYIQDKQERKKLITEQEKAQKNADDRIRGWMREFSLQNVTTQKPTPKLQKTFEKTRGELSAILELCKEHEFRPVIVSMPAAKEEYSQFSQEFIQGFYRDNIKKANITNAPVLEYFCDPRFGDYNLFENYADCLNEMGRKLFAEVFIQDLKKLELWVEKGE